VVIGQQRRQKSEKRSTKTRESLELSDKAAYLPIIWGWSRRTMARKPRHFWKSSLVAMAAISLALPPALAAMTRTESRPLSISETLLGEFTPAAGDPRLIARYAKVSEAARRGFSFTPAVTEESRKNRAITVVIRARDDASSAARTAGLAKGRTAPVAIAPVAYNLGASVGFEKFVTPQLPRGTDLRNLPVARALTRQSAGSGVRPGWAAIDAWVERAAKRRARQKRNCVPT
jgi:hypothetical protein